jgi:hypothetical protein
MHPTTLRVFERLKRSNPDHWSVRFCEVARHVHASRALGDAACAIANHQMSVLRDAGSVVPISAPIGATLPGQKICLTVEGDPHAISFLTQAEFGGPVDWSVVVYGPTIREGHPYARWVPGRPILCRDDASRDDAALVVSDAFRFGIILSLMNEPRRVSLRPASGLDWTRQHRKRIERLTGKPALAYSNVSWQVGAGVRAKNSKDGDSDLKMPLHWCRAHWRKAEPGMASAQWLEPTQGSPAGWYLRVKDCWRGHPDHGIKLQRHMPRMPGEKISEVEWPSGPPSEAKLAAMGAQQRAAMVQAGFAPSAWLH